MGYDLTAFGGTCGSGRFGTSPVYPCPTKGLDEIRSANMLGFVKRPNNTSRLSIRGLRIAGASIAAASIIAKVYRDKLMTPS